MAEIRGSAILPHLAVVGTAGESDGIQTLWQASGFGHGDHTRSSRRLVTRARLQSAQRPRTIRLWPLLAEAMLAANLVNDGHDGSMLELDHLAALLAVKMFVLRIAIIVFIKRPRTNVQAAQHAGVNQFAERAVNRRTADLETLALDRLNKLVGVEVVVLAEDIANQLPLLLGVPLGPMTASQVFPEFVLPGSAKQQRRAMTRYLLPWTRSGCRRYYKR